MARRLTNDDIIQIYELHLSGHSIMSIAEKVERDRATVRKAIMLGKELYQQQVAKANSSLLEQHFTDLSNELLKFIPNLKFMTRYIFLQNEMISEIVIDEKYDHQINHVDGYITDCLLSHLKTQLTELAKINKWEHLRVKDITDDLIVKLSRIAWQRQFSGTCDVCVSWQGTKPT